MLVAERLADHADLAAAADCGVASGLAGYATSPVNKRLINTEAKAFLVVFALAAMVVGAYTVLGTLLLRGNEQIGPAGMWVLLAISGTALLSAATALAVIAGGRVGGWWLLGSALASVAWFPAGLLLGE